MCLIVAHRASSLLAGFPSNTRIKLILFVLEFVNRDKTTSHSFENSSVVLLVGSAVQIRDRTWDHVGEDFSECVT